MNALYYVGQYADILCIFPYAIGGFTQAGFIERRDVHRSLLEQQVNLP